LKLRIFIMKKIELTMNEWSRVLGRDYRTLGRRLIARGYDLPARNGKVSLRQVLDALLDDSEKKRLLEAQALKLELENEVKLGELVAIEDVEEVIWENGLRPLREALLAFPDSAGGKQRLAMVGAGLTEQKADEITSIAQSEVESILERIRTICGRFQKRPAAAKEAS
jgi:hypothetical protein